MRAGAVRFCCDSGGIAASPTVESGNMPKKEAIKLDSLAPEALSVPLAAILAEANVSDVERSNYAQLRKTPTLKKLLAGSAEEQSELFRLAVQFVYDAKTYQGSTLGGESQADLASGVVLPELAKKGKLTSEAMAYFVERMVTVGAFEHQFFPVATILDRIADEDIGLPVDVVKQAKRAIDVYHLNDKPEGVRGMGFDGSSNTGIRLGLWLRRRGVEGPLLRDHHHAPIHAILETSNEVLADAELEPLANLMALALKPKAGKPQVAAARAAVEAVPADKLAAAVASVLDRIDSTLSTDPKVYRFEPMRPPAVAAVWTAALMMDDPKTADSLRRLVATCTANSATKSLVTASQIA